jgi:hypothetical protein
MAVAALLCGSLSASALARFPEKATVGVRWVPRANPRVRRAGCSTGCGLLYAPAVVDCPVTDAPESVPELPPVGGGILSAPYRDRYRPQWMPRSNTAFLHELCGARVALHLGRQCVIRIPVLLHSLDPGSAREMRAPFGRSPSSGVHSSTDNALTLRYRGVWCIPAGHSAGCEFRGAARRCLFPDSRCAFPRATSSARAHQLVAGRFAACTGGFTTHLPWRKDCSRRGPKGI